MSDNDREGDVLRREIATVKARREGFEAGAQYMFDVHRRQCRQSLCPEPIRGATIPHVMGESVRDIAARHFPLPKVRRPRVAADPHTPDLSYRVCVLDPELPGVLQFKWPSMGFERWDTDVIPRHTHNSRHLAARLALWADLLANPTEEVEL